MSDAIVAELVRELSPILIPIAVSAVGAAVSIGFSAVSRWSGGKIAADAAFQAKIEGIAKSYAGVEIAKAADNLAARSITVNDPQAAAVIAGVVKTIPEIETMTGWTDDRIAAVAVGEIGKLQATMTAAAPAKP
jgi:hypothetical protein